MKVSIQPAIATNSLSFGKISDENFFNISGSDLEAAEKEVLTISGIDLQDCIKEYSSSSEECTTSYYKISFSDFADKYVDFKELDLIGIQVPVPFLNIVANKFKAKFDILLIIRIYK